MLQRDAIQPNLVNAGMRGDQLCKGRQLEFVFLQKDVSLLFGVILYCTFNEHLY